MWLAAFSSAPSEVSSWAKCDWRNTSATGCDRYSRWQESARTQLRNEISLVQRLPQILKEALGIVRGVILYVIIGIAIGAAIHGYVPEGFFAEFMQRAGVFGVPASVLIAVPMYANAAGIVPVVEVFVAKGIPLGTALAFMMSVVGLSLPEATMLKKVMTWRLIGIFFGTVAVMIMLLGWLFNEVLPIL